MILKTNLVSWEKIQHCWLLLSPENLEYTLSILWVLSLVESYQDSSLSPMWVMVESHMCLGWVPCDWILYFVSPMCITKLLEWYTCIGHIYLILDMWVPNGPQFVNRGHGWLLCPGTPLIWVPLGTNLVLLPFLHIGILHSPPWCEALLK